MSVVPLLPVAHVRRIAPFFPLSRGLRRVDDRRVISGIVHVIRLGSMRARMSRRPSRRPMLSSGLGLVPTETPRLTLALAEPMLEQRHAQPQRADLLVPGGHQGFAVRQTRPQARDLATELRAHIADLTAQLGPDVGEAGSHLRAHVTYLFAELRERIIDSPVRPDRSLHAR